MKRIVAFILALFIMVPLMAAAETQTEKRFADSLLSSYQIIIGMGNMTQADPSAVANLLPFKPNDLTVDKYITRMIQIDNRTFSCALIIDPEEDALFSAVCTCFFMTTDEKELSSTAAMFMAFFSALYATDEKPTDMLKAVEVFSALEFGRKSTDEDVETTSYEDDRYTFTGTTSSLGWMVIAIPVDLGTE